MREVTKEQEEAKGSVRNRQSRWKLSYSYVPCNFWFIESPFERPDRKAETDNFSWFSFSSLSRLSRHIHTPRIVHFHPSVSTLRFKPLESRTPCYEQQLSDLRNANDSVPLATATMHLTTTLTLPPRWRIRQKVERRENWRNTRN